MITKYDLLTLIEQYANDKVACGIPTGDLWRIITADRFAETKIKLCNEIEQMYSDIRAEQDEYTERLRRYNE